jgi:ABC-type sugar transport system ATPase subunit
VNGVVVLRASRLSKTYGSFAALSDASLTVRAGEVRSLVGANGAGKSTLIKILTGAVRPNAGQIEISGKNVEPGDPARMLAHGVACIYQHSNLAPAMSVLDNIYLGRQPTRACGLLDRSRQRQDAEALLKLRKIDLDLDARVQDLPIVKRKEVEIAKALALNARILLLDEPTASLSHRDVARLHETIRSLRDSGVAIIYISHILDELYAVCDTVTVLRDGRVVEDCAVAAISRSALLQKFIGERLAAEVSDRSKRFRSTGAASQPRLACSGLTRSGDFADVSFEVRPGEILCITGLIGSKRSELVRAVLGADAFDAGEIRIEGVAVRPKSPIDMIRRGLGFVPEDRHRDGLMLTMSVERNLAMAALDLFSTFGVLRRRRMARAAAQQIAGLSITPADPRIEARKLSGGNQQKVLIGKWLLRKPKILILDEPTVGVDIGAKAEIYALLRALRDGGTAILVVTSDMDEVMTLADRIMVMCAGRVEGVYEAEKVTEREIVERVGGA